MTLVTIRYNCCGTDFQAQTRAQCTDAHVRYHNRQFARGRRAYRASAGDGGESVSPRFGSRLTNRTEGR